MGFATGVLYISQRLLFALVEFLVRSPVWLCGGSIICTLIHLLLGKWKSTSRFCTPLSCANFQYILLIRNKIYWTEPSWTEFMVKFAYLLFTQLIIFKDPTTVRNSVAGRSNIDSTIKLRLPWKGQLITAITRTTWSSGLTNIFRWLFALFSGVG